MDLGEQFSMANFSVVRELNSPVFPPSPVLSLVGDPEKFERLAVALSQLLPSMPGIALVVPPVEHRFTDGVYTRVFEAPAGAIVVGHKHKTRHENFIIQGSATVIINGERVEVRAGDILCSEAGARKVLLVHEKITWVTVHANPSNERDTDKLEEHLTDQKSALPIYTEEIDQIKELFHMERSLK